MVSVVTLQREAPPSFTTPEYCARGIQSPVSSWTSTIPKSKPGSTFIRCLKDTVYGDGAPAKSAKFWSVWTQLFSYPRRFGSPVQDESTRPHQNALLPHA